MTNVKEITTAELNEILANIEQVKNMGNIVHLTQYTAPRTTKKDRDTKEPFSGSVNKVTNLSVLLGLSYAKQEQKRLAEIGETYEAGIDTMPIDLCDKNDWFGTYKGQEVIRYKPNANSKPKTKYTLDSKLIDKDNLPNVLPLPSNGQKTPWRKLYTKGIRRISINGQKYKVVN
jgi:hypothetical protein